MDVNGYFFVSLIFYCFLLGLIVFFSIFVAAFLRRFSEGAYCILEGVAEVG